MEGGREQPSAGRKSLRDVYGTEIELLPESGSPELFRIMAEFDVDGAGYVALQNKAMSAEDEVELLRVVYDDGDEPRLETIEDDEEWETAAEAYDDMRFAGNEWP